MTRLPSLCLLVTLAFSTSLAAPTKEVLEVAIGEPHEVPVPKNVKISGPIDMPLPSWMAKEGDVLRMIAPPDALTSNTVVIGELTMEVVVHENEPTGCTEDEWAEAVLEEELSPAKLWEAIKNVEAVQSISMSDIRVVPRSYASTYRDLTSTEDGTAKGDTVIIVKTECGKPAIHIVETLYELTEQVSISKGSIRSRASRNEDPNSVLSSLAETSTDESIGEELDMHKEKETTTIASTTTTRHSRSTSVAYVSIKAIQCQQGAYCVSELEEKTFLGGNGGVNTFDLTIEHLSGKGGVNPWVVKEGKKRSIGVIPLTAGEHTFRLRGTDKKSNKPVIAPFSITVTADEPKNHQFKMTMHSLPLEPEYLRTMLAKMASFLRRNSDEIKVANVSRDDVAKISVVTYWNTSLPTTSCPTKEVAQWLRGLHIKHGEEVTNDFAKAFKNDPVIHPARLEVQWLGECEAAGAAAAEDGVKTAGGVAGSKGEEPTAEETDGSLSTLITVVCLLALLLVILILVVCCVACRKSKTHKGGVNEYMSKGTPVVFPDEVDDEHPDMHSATTPMLVKEERPPLRVSEHTNPIYKPPPPLASTAASPRPSVGPSAHKLPPPYVPP